MAELYNVFFYQPIFNLLIFLYNIIPGHDLGVAIIVLTIIVKLALYPLSSQAIKGQKELQELQPKLKKLKQEYKDDKEGLAKATMEFYKKEKVNPFSSCLPLLIQFPFLIAVYQVFRTGIINGGRLDLLYHFVSNPGVINTISFGILDLSKGSIILALLVGIAQFFQVKMLPTKVPDKNIQGAKDENMMASMNKQMVYIMPIFMAIISMGLSSGLVLYWFVNTLLTIMQQFIIFRKKS